jgi:hypothetical protein
MGWKDKPGFVPRASESGRLDSRRKDGHKGVVAAARQAFISLVIEEIRT